MRPREKGGGLQNSRTYYSDCLHTYLNWTTLPQKGKRTRGYEDRCGQNPETIGSLGVFSSYQVLAVCAQGSSNRDAGLSSLLLFVGTLLEMTFVVNARRTERQFLKIPRLRFADCPNVYVCPQKQFLANARPNDMLWTYSAL